MWHLSGSCRQVSTFGRVPPICKWEATLYFLARLYPDNPRQNQQIDGLGPGISQGPGAGVRRRAGGQDVIDQQNPRALGHLGPGGMEGESARDVAVALAAAEVTLGWSRAAPHQQVRNDEFSSCVADRVGEDGRLVVAPAQQAPAMQRHRR